MAKRFKINEFLTLKLKRGITYIYVKGEKFIQCKYLLMNISPNEFNQYNRINSIDEAEVIYDNSLEYTPGELFDISPQEEFWAHCSNIQAWAEYNYDTRILHRNIAFPLLKKLTEAGDPIAKIEFKKEIMNRYESGNRTVQCYLREEKYLEYLSKEELLQLMKHGKDPLIIDAIHDLTQEELIELSIYRSNSDTSNSVIFARTGQFYLQNYQNYEKAYELYNLAVALSPNFYHAWIGLAKAYEYLGDYSSCLNTYKKMLERNNDWIYMTDLTDFFITRKFEKFDPFLKDIVLMKYYGISVQVRGELNKSIIIFKHILRRFPDNGPVWSELGLSYYLKKKYDRAIVAYQNALNLDPNDVMTLTRLGNAYKMKCNYSQEIETYQKILRIDPNEEETYYSLGLRYRKLKQYDNAILTYKQLLKRDFFSSLAWFNLAVVYRLNREYFNAIEAYTYAKSLNRRNLHFLNELGICYLKINAYEKALKTFEPIVQFKPKCAAAWGYKNFLEKFGWRVNKELVQKLNYFKKILKKY